MDEKARTRKEKELTDMYTEVQKMRSESSAKFNEQELPPGLPIVKKVHDIAPRSAKTTSMTIFLKRVLCIT